MPMMFKQLLGTLHTKFQLVNEIENCNLSWMLTSIEDVSTFGRVPLPKEWSTPSKCNSRLTLFSWVPWQTFNAICVKKPNERRMFGDSIKRRQSKSVIHLLLNQHSYKLEIMGWQINIMKVGLSEVANL
jgi:hypothetical protein